jgi:hypothetical protein
MELVKGRGINCENEVYFDYVDGEVVMTIYRDMPGVRMDRRDPNVIKTFSVDQWGEVNKYLMETLDDVEGVFSDDDRDEEEEIQEKFDPITGTQNEEEEEKEAELPKVNSIPSMTEDDKEEIEEDGEENEQEGS